MTWSCWSSIVIQLEKSISHRTIDQFTILVCVGSSFTLKSRLEKPAYKALEFQLMAVTDEDATNKTYRIISLLGLAAILPARPNALSARIDFSWRGQSDAVNVDWREGVVIGEQCNPPHDVPQSLHYHAKNIPRHHRKQNSRACTLRSTWQ